jgi:excisionase family DNA binding protein
MYHRHNETLKNIKEKLMKNDTEAMNMAEAIEMLKSTRPTFYRWLRDGKIKGMKVGRQWRFYREDLERFLEGEAPRVDLPADITPLVKALEGKLESLDAPVADLREEQDPAARVIHLMTRLAYFSRASNLHLQAGNREGLLRMRIDGELQEVLRMDRRLVAPLVDRWKSLASCDLNEKFRPQDGRILMDIPSVDSESVSSHVDVRVCFVPSFSGECLTARFLDPDHASIQLDQIDLNPEDRSRLDRALKRKQGVVLMTGPTGSGKTTVLYACLNALRRPEYKLMTVEDPVSFTLPDVVQIRVRPQHGVTYAPALRAMLRSDPDVIMVGEIRDRDTLEVILQGAQNGHLMMSVLHTEDAVEALSRLVTLCEAPMMLAATISLIMAQRLVRCVCPHCSESADPDPGLLQAARKETERAGCEWPLHHATFVRGKGCAKCGGVGFRGRTLITETLEMTPELQTALRDGAEEAEIQRIALAGGMIPMAVDGIRKAAVGKTTLAEVARVLGPSWWNAAE